MGTALLHGSVPLAWLSTAMLLLASLYLNLADSYLALDHSAKATVAAEQGVAALQRLPADGYRDLVARGLQRLRARIAQAASPVAGI